MRIEIDWDELRRVRALHGQFPERWMAAGRMIVVDDVDKTIIGTMHAEDFAELIVRGHNMFLPLTNALVMCSRKLLDHVKIRRERDIEEELRSIWEGEDDAGRSNDK